ncbi:F510_1955 family glycosylhydrolase [Nocardioides sp.]|uniref:F510_1955 family glycosylhydrolase n=1 Tax=Nocardioides sp. TaxID=35761 RepID=UPI00286B8CC8|nr:hypothetical protein [Nocardioides sp.]
MPSSKITSTARLPGPTSRPRMPSPRSALIIAALAVALIAALLFALTRADRHPAAQASGGVEVGHIHGIGVDPADGQLYIGAHLGTFSVTGEGTVEPVGDVRNDTMAFTVAGPGRFLASGHPELGTDHPVHLGLIESRDAATTWEPVSLAGDADFHALDVATDGRTWGIDSARGLLLTSSDNRSWDTVAQGRFIDLAADPTGQDVTLATTGTGQLRFYDPAGTSTAVPGSPTLTFVDWAAPDLLVGLGPDGTVYTSTGTASEWQRAGRVPGQPSALEVTTTSWYAASDQGLFSSTTSGTSWEPVFTYGTAP